MSAYRFHRYHIFKGDELLKVNKLTRQDLIERISDESAVDTKVVHKVLDTFFTVVIDALKENMAISIYGFGTFQLKYFKARVKHNSNTKQKSVIPGRYLPKFSFSKTVTSTIKKQ